MRNLKFLIASSLALLVSSCSRDDDHKTLRVVASVTPHAELIEQIIPDLKKQGIKLELITMNDYLLPNKLVDEKEADVNFFQHIPFLDYQNKSDNLHLKAFGKIHLEPMGLYSKNFTLDSNLQKKTVALPLDPSNEKRALLLLEKAGLITLEGEKDTLQDITSNPFKLHFVEVEAACLCRLYDDVDLAIIPTNFALEIGLNPQKQALLLESSDSPYANILAIHPDNPKKEALNALLEALQSEKIKTYIETQYQGSIIPAR